MLNRWKILGSSLALSTIALASEPDLFAIRGPKDGIYLIEVSYGKEVHSLTVKDDLDDPKNEELIFQWMKQLQRETRR